MGWLFVILLALIVASLWVLQKATQSQRRILDGCEDIRVSIHEAQDTIKDMRRAIAEATKEK